MSTVTDEAVEAAHKTLWPSPDATFIAPSRDDIRAALTAALPHMSVVTDAEAVLQSIADRPSLMNSLDIETAAAITEALSSPAPEAATHRHKKRGSEYVLLGIDTETCMKCGGALCGRDDDDGQPDEAQEWRDYDPDC